MLKSVHLAAVVALSLAMPGLARAEQPALDTVVATVNGKPITLGHMIAMRDALPPQYLQLDDETLFNGILDQIIQQEAIAATVDGKLTRRDELMLENQRRGYLASMVIDRAARDAVTEEAVQKLFDERYGSQEPGKEYHAAHILVKTEDEAKAIKAELDKGADFATLAREKSIGPSGPNGGDLGWFGTGMMVKPFEDAVVALEPGQISDPVQTQFGWHVIKLDEVRDAKPVTLDDVRAELEQELEQQAVEKALEELTAGATVEKSADGIDPAVIRSAEFPND